MPSPARTTTIPANKARCWPEDSSIYLPRRCQNRAGDGFPPVALPDLPERSVAPPPVRPLAVPLSRDGGGGGTLGVPPEERAGGLACVRPVPVPVPTAEPAPDQPAVLRAQPAEELVLPSCLFSGSGGADRLPLPLDPLPAAGH